MIGLRERPLLREEGYQPPPIDRLPETTAKMPPGLARFGRPRGARQDVEQRALPTIAPGQLWLVQAPAAADLRPFEFDAFSTANVVIYDRELTPFVAASLPLGSYAEPATPLHRALGASEFERALRVAFDGWSVVRLLGGDATASDRIARIHRVAARLRAAGIAAELPVQLVTDTAGAPDTTEVTLGDLADALDIYDFGRRITAVFATRHGGSVGPLHAVVDNGLAG